MKKEKYAYVQHKVASSIRGFEKSAFMADFLRLNSVVNEGRSVI